MRRNVRCPAPGRHRHRRHRRDRDRGRRHQPGGQWRRRRSEPAGFGLAAASPATSDAPTDEPSPADEDEALAVLAEIEEQVIAHPRPARRRTSARRTSSRATSSRTSCAPSSTRYPPAEAAEDNRPLRALGLLEPDQDVAELQLQLLGDQVLGFYDDNEKRMVVVTDAGPQRAGEDHVRARVHPRPAGRCLRHFVAGPRGGGR